MYTLVIADDENIECISLKLLLQSEFPEISVVAIAANGIELMNAVAKYNPDIALVDVNMPGVSGLEAIEMLRMKGFKETKYIILTAYDEFTYVQTALSLKVSEYILKPLKRDVITKILNETCKNIDIRRRDQESHELNEKVFSKMDDVLEKEILYSILMGEPDRSDFETFCEMNQCEFSRGVFITVVPGESKEKFSRDMKEQIRKFMRNILKNMGTYLFSMNDNHLYIMVFVPQQLSSEEVQGWIENLVAILVNELLKQFGAAVRAGISNIHESFEKLCLGYQESRISLDTLPGQDIVFYTQIQSVAENMEKVDLDKYRYSEKKIKNPYIIQAVQYIHENYSRDISLEEIADHIGISSFHLSRTFKTEMGIKLSEYITGIRMDKALLLVKNTSMTISEIGEQVGYGNPTYFCRIFKKNTGKTIGEIRKEK